MFFSQKNKSSSKKIIFNQKEVDIVISDRARSIKLSFAKGRLRLTLPRGVSEKRGLQFMQDQWDWVVRQEKKQPAPYRFQTGMTISLLGQDLQIVHQPAARRGVWQEENKLYVSGEEAFLHRRVCDYIKRVTLPALKYIVQEKTAVLGVKAGKITLRDTSSRWGSCSSTGNLSFCWKIALAPDFVRDYLVAHEVAHLKEMNHSDRFWALVAQLTDSRALAHSWLRRHGGELQAIDKI